MDIVSDSVGDLWIHREKADLWWTVTNDAPAVIELIDAFEPDNDGTRLYVANKPAGAWTNKSKAGAPLR